MLLSVSGEGALFYAIAPVWSSWFMCSHRGTYAVILALGYSVFLEAQFERLCAVFQCVQGRGCVQGHGCVQGCLCVEDVGVEWWSGGALVLETHKSVKAAPTQPWDGPR